MLRRTFAAAALCVITTAAVADPIVPTAQQRSVRCSAYVEDFDGQSDESDDASAVDFAPFDAAVNANVELGSALGDGGSTQRSEIGPNVISASGGFFGTAEAYDFGAYANGSGDIDFSVDFELLQASAFRLAGTLSAFDNGSVLVHLTGPGGSVYYDDASGPSQMRDIDTRGMLPAGSYTLQIDGTGSADAFDFDFSYGSGDYDITLVVGASGPGGETPDGKDVPGTPLLLRKFGSSSVELSWGVSCRPDDSDFSVYEGTIGEPTSLMVPVVCSTGGARRQTVSTAGSKFYLIVPSDGANEGSYGDSSDGSERVASLTACAPQVLAAPTCP